MGTRLWGNGRIDFQLLRVRGDEGRLIGRKKNKRRDERRKDSLSVLNTFHIVDCHPKTMSLQRAARNGTSGRNVLSLYRKQHITASGLENSTLHEVTAFWGQHSRSLGVKLTPQLDQENVRECVCVCVSVLVYVRACACECVCTHSCVSSMTHIPIFLPLRKLVDPGMCWYLGGVPLQAQLLWPKTKCRWLLHASHTGSVLSLTSSLLLTRHHFQQMFCGC